jgi:hypothetical protein
MMAMDSLASFLVLGPAIRRDDVVYAQGDSGRFVGKSEAICQLLLIRCRGVLSVMAWFRQLRTKPLVNREMQ